MYKNPSSCMWIDFQIKKTALEMAVDPQNSHS